MLNEDEEGQCHQGKELCEIGFLMLLIAYILLSSIHLPISVSKELQQQLCVSQDFVAESQS